MTTIILFCLLHYAHAHADDDLSDRLDAIEEQGLWNEMLINTSSPRAHIKHSAEPCEPHWIDVVDHKIVRKCGSEPLKKGN